MFNPELFIRVNEYANSLRVSKVEECIEFQQEEEKLLRFMKTHKPYLEPALTLQELSEKLGIPVKRLSVIINQKKGKHYFDFVNSYRIEDAKKLLKEDELTVKEIMYEVGFNSKSSFNTAFKKVTNQTPSSFKSQSV